MKYGISWRSFVFPVERFLGAFFCFLWNEMLRTLPTSQNKLAKARKTRKSPDTLGLKKVWAG